MHTFFCLYTAPPPRASATCAKDYCTVTNHLVSDGLLFSMKPLLASSVALAFLSCVCGSWLDGNVGVDRYGGNLPDQNFTMNMTAQPKDCALLCRANVKCLAWVYAKPDCGAATHPLCLQKAVSNNSQSRNPCVVREKFRAG